MNSMPLRNAAVIPEAARGNGIHIIGNGNKFINLVVHDAESGFFTSNSSSNTEIYGSLTYNNGVYRGTNGLGHGMYLENIAGFSRIHDNIVLNNFNLGTQCFGMTASYVGGDFNGSVFANSGSPLARFNPTLRNPNLLVGTNSQRIPNITIKNSFFYQPHSTEGGSLSFGYGAGVDNGQVTDNYFVGGSGLIGVGNTTSITVTGNKFYSGPGFSFYTVAPQGVPYNWDNNTYHGAVGRDVFGIAGQGVYQFNSWRTRTGFDANSTVTSVPMPDTAIVRPNAYQTGRANIVVYVTSGANSVSVNLSNAGLTNGQSYKIKNAFNYSGQDVLTGTYNSSSPTISLPLSGAAASVATPVGYDYTPPTTTPHFGVFILIPN
jgi:hypothetical protein